MSRRRRWAAVGVVLLLLAQGLCDARYSLASTDGAILALGSSLLILALGVVADRSRRDERAARTSESARTGSEPAATDASPEPPTRL